MPTSATMTKPRKPAAGGLDVSTMKATIGTMTGRVPSSSDPRYLRQRLNELGAKRDAGEDIRHRSSPHSVMSVSMPVAARAAVDRILKREKCGGSELIRRALASWALRYGYRDEAKEIGKP